jgi:hypothetical protein
MTEFPAIFDSAQLQRDSLYICLAYHTRNRQPCRLQASMFANVNVSVSSNVPMRLCKHSTFYVACKLYVRNIRNFLFTAEQSIEFVQAVKLTVIYP